MVRPVEVGAVNDDACESVFEGAGTRRLVTYDAHPRARHGVPQEFIEAVLHAAGPRTA